MNRNASVVAVGVALAALALLTACSSSPTYSVESARNLPGAPGWVGKPTGVDCGEVELGGDGTVPQRNLECMRNASKVGNAAFLAWTERTTEGDPIPHFARTVGEGFAVASTTAYDTYGEGGWTQSSCSTAARISTCADTAD